MSDHARPRPPFGMWLLLRWYPAWFLEEFGEDLRAHLRRQRAEERYTRPLIGPLRFWAHAIGDACRAGVELRIDHWKERRGRTQIVPDREEVGMFWEGMTRDLRQAGRSLARTPGYVAVFVLTLGLGIGANTAMFSAVNSVLLKPLPHEDGDRLVYLRHHAPRAGLSNTLFSVPEIEDYRSGATSLEAVAEFSAMTFNMLGHDTPRRVRAGIVTGNYFDVMGLRATLGRTITAGDDGEEAASVMVLSDPYWRQVFGGDPEVIGRTVRINGRTVTVVGVLEPAPPYPEQTDIYVNMTTSPHHLDASMTHDRIHRMTEVFARLTDGATVQGATTEVDAITTRIHAEYPEAYDVGTGYEVRVRPLKDQLTANARPTLLLLLGTALFVLIIACANLANLTLTRVLRREHEFAIRVSLGGSRSMLRRQLLGESLILSGLGAALGLVLAWVSVDLLVAFAERFTSRAGEIRLDGTVFVYALSAAVLASFFFTMLPTLPGGRGVGVALTRAGTRTTAGSSGRRAQRTLVVAQIATSFVLLIGAGLLLRTMMHLGRVDPGFDTATVLSLDIPANEDGRSVAEIREYYNSIVREARVLPGVTGVALTNVVPMGGPGTLRPRFEISVDGHEPAPGAPTPRADFRVVTPDFFRTMGIELVSGREFRTTDQADSQPVVVINTAMARAYFGERDAVGEQIAWTDDVMHFLGVGPEMRTVIGVAEDTRDYGLDAGVQHVMYNPYAQVNWTGSLVVRMTGDPGAVITPLRDMILAHDPNQPIDNLATLQQLGERSVAPRRLNTILLGSFAFLALLIAAVGIGGVLAFSVGTRVREFGVKAALGADRRQVRSGVLAEGAGLAALGVVLGVAAALALGRAIAPLLVGVPAFDPVTFVGVALLLIGVAVAACWVPAWRASRVSPLEALSAE
ncbi:MAG: ABC transporter permease [Gemmatimonadota bacterium]